MTKNAVSYRIMELCQDRNITLNKLATITGITQSTLNDIVNGNTKSVNLRTVERICNGLNISIYDFFNTPDFKTNE